MLVYRVCPYLPDAAPGHPGHPLYVHKPQRAGRIDHPDYSVWYTARTPEAACGETFGNLPRWSDSMFDFPALDTRRVLVTASLPDNLRICDLDDAHRLVQLGLRPTQVVARNLAVTQSWGHRIWSERDPHDTAARRWDAVSWWSFHRPSWTVTASWTEPEVQDISELTLDHPAIAEARQALLRPV